MLFWTFRVNKRPTNIGADDWFVKCYENGMDHRLNRLLNPTFNNKNMEVRYYFLVSFRLKSMKNGTFLADMYIFLNFPDLRQLSQKWRSSRNHTATDRQTNYCGVSRDAKNCGMGPGPWLRTRERKTSNGHMEGVITIPLVTTKAKQSTQNEA